MNVNKPTTPKRSATHDPDDAPELDAEWFGRAELRQGNKVVRRGRPPGATKVSTTIRFDADVLERLKESGPGWQTRVNDLVRAAMSIGITPPL